MTRILGIDPGSRATGFGLVETINNRLSYVKSGCIRPSPKNDFCDRLNFIYKELIKIIDIYSPNVMAIEDIFVAKNVRSALKLGQVRGAVMIASVNNGIKVAEYPATKVKQALVGNGRAEKNQVAEMVKLILKIEKPKSLDEGDALAVAICHGHTIGGLR